MLDPHLRRSKNVPGGMQRDTSLADGDRFPVGQRLDRRVRQAAPQHAFPWRGAQVAGRSWTRVVAVRVRDHRAVDRLPGIDVKAARLAVEPLRRRADHHASAPLAPAPLAPSAPLAPAPSAPARTFSTISTTAISTTPNSAAATGHGTNHRCPRRDRYHTM